LYLYGYASVFDVVGTHFAVPDAIPGWSLATYYEVVRAGAYLYGHNKTGSDYWEVDEVVDRYDLTRGIEQSSMFDQQTEDERLMLWKLPFEMKDWKEKRGDEVMEWDH
jgi:hypothetical protein